MVLATQRVYLLMSIHCLLPEMCKISLCWKFLVWLDSLTNSWLAVGLERKEASRLSLQPFPPVLGSK